MIISQEAFDNLIAEALDNLPDNIREKMNNAAVFSEDYPNEAQLKKLDKKPDMVVYGLFEGYGQAKRINIGAVLPDRITLFRMAICDNCFNEEEIRKQIASTLKHEIAHHFGSDETGARKASKNRA